MLLPLSLPRPCPHGSRWLVSSNRPGTSSSIKAAPSQYEPATRYVFAWPRDFHPGMLLTSPISIFVDIAIYGYTLRVIGFSPEQYYTPCVYIPPPGPYPIVVFGFLSNITKHHLLSYLSLIGFPNRIRIAASSLCLQVMGHSLSLSSL